MTGEEIAGPSDEMRGFGEGERVTKTYSPGKTDIFNNLLNEDQAEENMDEKEEIIEENQEEPGEEEKEGEKEEEVKREKKKKTSIKIVNGEKEKGEKQHSVKGKKSEKKEEKKPEEKKEEEHEEKKEKKKEEQEEEKEGHTEKEVKKEEHEEKAEKAVKEPEKEVGEKGREEESETVSETAESEEDIMDEWADEVFDEDEVGEEGESEKELGTKEEGTTKAEKEEIKKTIMKKAEIAGLKDNAKEVSGIKLSFLEDEEKGNVFIGTKKNIHKKYGYNGALFVGKVKEDQHRDKNVYLDSLNPHVVFVCGARGSGKSYVMGVIAEELAQNNKNIGIIVIDPIGVFWSMKFPNKEEKEIKAMAKWGITPEGLDNLKVFIPDGVKAEVPKSTYDAGFSLQPSLLTVEDWCLTFGIDRFSPTGLLLDKGLAKVKKGYKQLETGKPVKGKGKKYAIHDIITCLETDSELNSRERGYKQDSIRALASRFEAADGWGIFYENGTPLSELSREGQLTILDTSFLEDTVTALVIGILARRVLSARKVSTRKEAASKFKNIKVDELLELEIPPTWLFIDEAHTLIPSGTSKTPATDALVEYVKQGRRPGCSLVFATQQPSAIDTKVLSQLDVIMCHKLVFDDDIKSVYRRTPTIIPMSYKRGSFIKTLPVGVALTGDRREETSRAFVMGIRPRRSQHEGRDAETVDLTSSLKPEQVELLATEIIMRDLQNEPSLEIEKIETVLATLNSKYKTDTKLEAVLDTLRKKKVIVTEDNVCLKTIKKIEAAHAPTEAVQGEEATGTDGTVDAPEAIVDDETGEMIELLALPVKVKDAEAKRIVDKARKKKLFGLVGSEETVEGMNLKYYTVWRVKYEVYTGKNEFIRREAFIDSISGEFLHFANNQFVESNGVKFFYDLGPDQLKVLRLLMKNELIIAEIMGKTEFSEGKVSRILQRLIEMRLIGMIVEKKTNKKIYWVKEKLDLPPSERHELLQSLNNLPFVRAEALEKERELIGKDKIPEMLAKLWENVIVKSVKEIYRPVWEAKLSLNGKEREVKIDAVTGRAI